MGLRCLIGHDFDERQTEREREERGEEVVVTVREYRECTRCGHRRIISENKEVTVDSTPDEPEPEPEPSDAPEEPDDEFEEIAAEEDDGVILDDEPDPGHERGHGEWPESEAEDPAEAESEPRDWPETPGEDEGFDAEPDDGRSADDVEFRGSLTPERASDVAATADPVGESPADEPEPIDAEPEVEVEAGAEADTADPDGADGRTAESPSGIRSAGSVPSPTGQQRMADVETEFVCPECDHTVPGSGSSLRPGDICPECRRGYLTEREQ